MLRATLICFICRRSSPSISCSAKSWPMFFSFRLWIVCVGGCVCVCVTESCCFRKRYHCVSVFFFPLTLLCLGICSAHAPKLSDSLINSSFPSFPVQIESVFYSHARAKWIVVFAVVVVSHNQVIHFERREKLTSRTDKWPRIFKIGRDKSFAVAGTVRTGLSRQDITDTTLATTTTQVCVFSCQQNTIDEKLFFAPFNQPEKSLASAYQPIKSNWRIEVLDESFLSDCRCTRQLAFVDDNTKENIGVPIQSSLDGKLTHKSIGTPKSRTNNESQTIDHRSTDLWSKKTCFVI